MITKAEDTSDHYLLNGAKMDYQRNHFDLAIVGEIGWCDSRIHCRNGREGFTAPEQKGNTHFVPPSPVNWSSKIAIPKDRMLPKAKGLSGPSHV